MPPKKRTRVELHTLPPGTVCRLPQSPGDKPSKLFTLMAVAGGSATVEYHADAERKRERTYIGLTTEVEVVHNAE